MSRLLTRQDEIEDVVQEVFLIAAKNLEGLAEPAQARGWLKRVALRKAARHLRWRRVRTGFGLLSPSAIDECLISAEATPEARALLRQVLARLDRMPTELRLAWSLRYLHEERLETVAELCGCSLSTAKRRIDLAQAKILEGIGDD